MTPETTFTIALDLDSFIKNLKTAFRNKSSLLPSKWEGYKNAILSLNDYKCVLAPMENVTIKDTFVVPLLSNSHINPETYYALKENDELPKGTIRGEEILDLLQKQSRILIWGGPGSGKTMFLKWLLLKTVERNDAKISIPIYVQLSYYNLDSYRLNDDDKPLRTSLEKLLLERINSCGMDYDAEQFTYCLKEGIFTFFLDGYDEINDRSIDLEQQNTGRNIFQNELNYILERYGNKYAKDNKYNRFVFSSRPADDLMGISGMLCYNICPFPRHYAINQIKQLPDMHEGIVFKNAFIDELKEKDDSDEKKDIYGKNPYFASNPLLLSFMYRLSQEYDGQPKKQYKLYNEIFDSLYINKNRFKNTPAGANRRFKTKFSQDEFESVLSVYSYVWCYSGKKEPLDEDQFIHNLNLVRRTERFSFFLSSIIDDSFSPKDYLYDLVSNVGLFHKLSNGKYEIIHETFFEYFAMRLLCRIHDDPSLQNLANTLIERQTFFATTSMIFRMMYEKNQMVFEMYVLYPQLVRFEKEELNLNQNSSDPTIDAYFQSLIPDIVVNADTNRLEFGHLDSHQYKPKHFLVACADYYIQDAKQKNRELQVYDLHEQTLIKHITQKFPNRFSDDKLITISFEEIYQDNESYEALKECWIGTRVKTLYCLKRDIEKKIEIDKMAKIDKMPTF